MSNWDGCCAPDCVRATDKTDNNGSARWDNVVRLPSVPIYDTELEQFSGRRTSEPSDYAEAA